jgi:hypothetical protein
MDFLRSHVKQHHAVRTALFLGQNGRETLRYAMSRRGACPVVGACAQYLNAMIRVKNEARFLPEWIAHHLNLGVGHVFVYDNASSDETRGAIAPFLKSGLATYLYWPIAPASPSCDVDFLERFGSESRWVAFFDADEFLFERWPGATMQILKAYEDRPAVAVNWRYFGSAGHTTIPAGLVTDRFRMADVCGDDHVKVIVQPSEVFRYRNSHGFYYRRGRLGVTPQGRRVCGSFSAWAPAPALVLHHYVYRSREDYERKLRMGFVDARGANSRARNHRRAQAEFHLHNEVAVGIPERVIADTAQTLHGLGFPSHLFESS